ncbi:RidA family protein [Acinetobacter sp.]|uniref:RidA family protein n=1 Tax=Acinetobacter sp. TaxID=472 RepID=UPI0025870A7F|nr:RidA family protein [Acinetobacter sp.]
MIDIQRFHSGNRASQVVICGQHIETAGIVAKCTDKGVTQQTFCVLAQLEQLLLDIGTDKNRIIRIQIWLASMADFDEMNQVYDTWVSTIEKPARACVGAQLASPQYLIEIQATATF